MKKIYNLLTQCARRTLFLHKTTLLLLVALGLFGVNDEMLGGQAYVYAYSDPQDGGYVYVAKSSSAPSSYSKTSDVASQGGFGSSGNKTFYLFYQCKNSNYVFKGWKKVSAKETIQDSNSTDNSTQGWRVTQSATGFGEQASYYNAIFACCYPNTPSSGSSLEFEDVNVGSLSNEKTIKINHAHAGTVTISQSGDVSDFLVTASSGATINTTELNSFESKKGGLKTIYVKFVPQNNGLRSCTLTVSCPGFTSMTYYLQGHGYNVPSITWVDGEGNELTSGETTLSVGDVLRASCTSGQTVSYTNYNANYFTAGTDASGNPILTVKEGISGTINGLSVTGNLAKKTSNYYAAHSANFSLNITNLTPQTIEWTNDLADISNELIGQTKTLNAVAKNAKTGENSGQAIIYTMAANDYLSLSGNVLTINAVGGPIAITATAAGNENYAPTSVTKYATVINMTDPCANSDIHSNGQFNEGGNHEIYPTLPTSITFTAKREKSTLLKDLVIRQFKADGSEIASLRVTKNHGDVSTSGTSFTIDSDPSVTKIRFEASKSAKYTYYISNITTIRKTESSVKQGSNAVTALSYATEPGQSLGKQITVTYSNVPVFLSFKSDEDANVSSGKSLWSVNTSSFGGCGKNGSSNVTVTFKSDKHGDYMDILYVRNNVGDLLHTIDLSASVTLHERELDSWNVADTYNTTDEAQLTASTKGGNDAFEFFVVTSNPANIVSIDKGVMTFTGAGTATIKAYDPILGIYDEYSTTHDITINPVTPTIKETNKPTATLTCYGKFDNISLTGGEATVTLHNVADTHVDGHFEWVKAGDNVTDAAGSHNYDVKFVPDNDKMYNTTTFSLATTVNLAPSTLSIANGTTIVSLPEDGAELDLLPLVTRSNEANMRFDVTSANAQFATVNNAKFSATAVDDYTIHATMDATDYYTGNEATFTVKVNEGITFQGDAQGRWTEENSPAPTDRVIVNANVDVVDEVAVGSLTINENNTVTIKNGGSLEVGNNNSLGRLNYGNIIVESSGKLILGEGKVYIKELTLYSGFDDAQNAHSGQVINQRKLILNGDDAAAYFILDLDKSGEASYGWYDFSVPFHVDALHGITRWENNEWMPLTNEYHYAVMTYNEAQRARTSRGWKKYTGILQPGTGYTITPGNEVNRYRFEMVHGEQFVPSTSETLTRTNEGADIDRGWNSVGNGTMEYVDIANAPAEQVQMYDHNENAYHNIWLEQTPCSFAVGAAYFVQAITDQYALNLSSASQSSILRAPQRSSDNDNCRFSLSLKADNKEHDLLIISCDAEATNTYTVGKDVQKMGALNASKIGRLWTNAKGGDLCAYNAAFVNGQAIVPLNIFVPTAGEYAISLNSTPAEEVYLRRNGVIIWNMEMGDYFADFQQGTDDSYELLVIRHVQNITTGIDAVDNGNAKNATIFVEKMIVDDQLYILRDGVLYDAQGRVVTKR